METLLTLLQLNAREIAADCAIIKQNHIAMRSMADDVIAAIEGTHREFSMFTPANGRA